MFRQHLAKMLRSRRYRIDMLKDVIHGQRILDLVHTILHRNSQMKRTSTHFINEPEIKLMKQFHQDQLLTHQIWMLSRRVHRLLPFISDHKITLMM
jgi:hypothetical protein